MSNRNKKGRNVKETKTGKPTDLSASKEALGAKEVANTPKQEAAPSEVKPVLIKVVKKDAKYRGAREAWYVRLIEHDGKTVDEFVESCKDKCPQLTKNGTVENPTGWIGFFKRQGVLQEVKGE